MSEWKQYKLGDTCEITTGFAFKGDEYEPTGNLKVVRGENVTIGRLRWDSEKHWNKSTNDLTKYFLRHEDIVIGMDGSRVGQNRAIIRKEELPLILAQRVACLRARKGFNQKFLWYNVFNDYFREYVEAIHTGTSIPHISQSQIADYEFSAPTEIEQKSIAEILSSLDDKIDLLYRQNKTLEQLAETLFRKWFIEEISDNGTTLLAEFSENIRSNVSVSELSKYNNYVGLEHIPQKSISLSNWGNPNGLESNKSMFLENDILFGKLRSYFHKVVFAPISGVCSTDILVIRPKQQEWLCFCLFWFSNSELVEYSDLASGGTRMPRTSWEIISNYQIPKPEVQKISAFNDFALPKLQKIKSNIRQLKTLTLLRDSMLPKLMNGELKSI